MKTDTIFYSLFQAFPSIFFELINQSPDEAVVYEFTSREIKQLAFRLDGLLKVGGKLQLKSRWRGIAARRLRA